MLKLAWPRVAMWRARRHHLDRRAPSGSMLAVTSRLCGLHAQVLSSAELSLWARVENLDRGVVPRALWHDRSLVKTWAMRGTLHLLPAAEMPLWHAALATSRRYRRPGIWRRLLGITLDEADRLTEAIGSALAGRVLSREELVKEVGRITGSRAFAAKLALNGWGTVLKPAAFTGRLCFAPSLGQRVRFTHPQSWLADVQSPRNATFDPQSATAAITRRYLAAYGPATYHDFARWWGGASVATARQWIASLGDEVAAVDLDGVEAWMLSADARKLRDLPSTRSVRLLPAFDHYVVAASRHAEHLLPGDLRGRIYRPQGWISPVLAVNGFMHGIWRHELKGSTVEITIEPFIKPQPWVRRAVAGEAERLAEFLGGKLSLVWKK
ncbi:MAG TPA: winged helix DNA-binding domain-containing protein [Bryobacteraceae bacterium]|nr:winged helix DNA-binding domain-containing protein [Bryobacteraceae bacterium]